MLKQLVGDDAFGEVPAQALHVLVDGSTIQAAIKGEGVYEKGERWGRLGFVIDGCVAMLANGEDAKEHLYEHVFPGNFFGVSAMLDGGVEMARTAVVSRKACLALMDGDAVIDLCKQHGTLAIAFAVTLARRIRHTTALLAAQLNLTAQERIARYLLRFAGDTGLSEALEPLPQMTQAQIGAAAGTVKDVAARTIGLLEREGALKRERGHIQLVHREILARFARLVPMLFFALVSFGFASAAPSLAPAEHGTFDHYTFALTWQPGICGTEEGCLPDQPKTPLIGLHGLWASLPQDLHSQGVVDQQWWSKGCDLYQHSSAPPPLSPALDAQLEGVMPHFTHSLLTHEYVKHVQCFGFDATQFFETELAMRAAVESSAFGAYLQQQAGRDVEHSEVVDRFKTAFGTEHATALQLQCGKTVSGQVVLTQFWFQIPASDLGMFPQAASFMDTPSNEDTCPASFRIPAW